MPLKHLRPEMHAMAILAKNHQMAGENLNEVPRSAPYKVEKVIKMMNLGLYMLALKKGRPYYTGCLNTIIIIGPH